MLLVLALLLSACANHEGIYEPACIAYQGDKIELQDGRFTWQRYTDERTVDEAGNVVEPFPEFPKTGSYRVSAGKLELVTDDNVAMDDWFVVEHAGQRYLLDAGQHNAFLEGGELPKCALRFTAANS
jgi:hypothetical protein